MYVFIYLLYIYIYIYMAPNKRAAMENAQLRRPSSRPTDGADSSLSIYRYTCKFIFNVFIYFIYIYARWHRTRELRWQMHS